MTDARTEQPVAEYVVGYCFRSDFKLVALIEKLKPAWQWHKLNGIGGKIEPGESPHDAMVREFEEEAGARIGSWLHIRTEQFYAEQEAHRGQPTGARVHHFACCATDAEWAQISTRTAEQVFKVDYPLRELRRYIYNLPYLMPMAEILLQQPAQNRPVP